MSNVVAMLVAGCSLVTATHAQSKYWGFNHDQILRFDPFPAPPAVHGPLSTVPTPPASPSVTTVHQNLNAHTIFDGAGNALFSVDVDGIYDRSGVLVDDLTPYLAPPRTTYINSEIEVFPKMNGCPDQYYVMYTLGGSIGELRLVEVDASYAIYSSLNLTHNILSELRPPVYSDANYTPTGGIPFGYGNGIVATPIDINRSRKVYVLSDNFHAPGIPSPSGYAIKSWRFDADGTYTALPEQPLSYTDLPGRLTFMEATPDGAKLAYPGPYGLKVFNVGTGVVTNYPISALTTNSYLSFNDINGIEFVPQYQRWYVSFTNLPSSAPGTKVVGNIAYFDAAVPGVLNSVSSGLTAYGASELELGSDNKLYFASCPTCNVPSASTYDPYIIGKSSISPYSAYYSPGNLIALDPSSHSFSTVPGIKVKMSQYHGWYYYLNNQIDGENYLSWSAPAGTVAGFDINNGVSYLPATGCSVSTPIGPLQIIKYTAPLDLNFKNPSGFVTTLSLTEQYSISWGEADACGTYVISSPVNYTDGWHSGSGPIDLKTYGSGVLGTPAVYGKNIALTVGIKKRGCFGIEDSVEYYRAFIKVTDEELPCKTDFSTVINSTNPLTLKLNLLATTPGSTYKVDWGDGPPSWVPFTSSHTYASDGVKNICVGEYRDGSLFCSTCQDICLDEGSYWALPDTCMRIERINYSVHPSFVSVSPVLIHPTSTYTVSWGTSFIPSYVAWPAAYLYPTAGTYRVCMRERDSATGNLLCTACIDICVTRPSPIRKTNETMTEGGEASTLTLYPNPARNTANLLFEQVKGKRIGAELYTLEGKRVQTLLSEQLAAESSFTQTVDLNGVAAGIYLCRYRIEGEYRFEKIHVIN